MGPSKQLNGDKWNKKLLRKKVKKGLMQFDKLLLVNGKGFIGGQCSKSWTIYNFKNISPYFYFGPTKPVLFKLINELMTNYKETIKLFLKT